MPRCTCPDAEEGIAKSILEACGWDVGMAVNMYVDANYTASTSSRTIESASAPEPPKPEPVNMLSIHSVC